MAGNCWTLIVKKMGYDHGHSSLNLMHLFHSIQVSSQGSTASRMRRNRRRARSSNIPTQKFPQRASSIGSVSSHGSTSSSTDPQYLTPFNAVTDSSYVYNEVYRRLETDDQRRSKSSTKGWTRRFSEDETESSSGEGSQKRVTFSRSVQVSTCP